MEHVPIYVKVDKYRELLGILKKLDAKLANVNKMIGEINALKDQEDAQLRQWNENLADIQERLGKIHEVFGQ